ncbi:MAG: GDSL family lipase [Candidatus Omnitrophica bacterium]|nr:GDSL family lipase [Candidatus Omnitrophota bacterium]
MYRKSLLWMMVLSVLILSNPHAFCAETAELHSAIAPASREGDWWKERHASVVEQAKKGEAELILIGDSITHGWDNQPELYQKYFGKYKPINMGFGGDRTQHVLWRLDHGEIDGISPKVAMLMIGTNNSNGEDNTAEEIADGIIAIVHDLREKLPDTKVLILAIFPRGEGPSPQREKNAKASELASEIADDDMIYYLDINDEFLKDDKTLTKEIMPDLLHPSKEGYVIWGDAVTPKIEELMKE